MSPADVNWHMTELFLLALALLLFLMNLIALLVNEPQYQGTQWDRKFSIWLLPAPHSLRRLQPVTSISSMLLRMARLLGAVVLSYWVYWKIVDAFHIRGIWLSYLAGPMLLLISELAVAVVRILWLPSGRLLPALHRQPWLARGVADFWGRRWNLWFSNWFRHVIFSPLRHRPLLALLLVFAVSGVMHEWVLNVPLFFATGRALFGTMMVYFLLQGVGVLLERRFFPRRSWTRILLAWMVVFVPAPLVLNEGLLRTLHLWPE
jgi:hypothetical protein